MSGVPAVAVHDDRVLIELTSSAEMLEEARESYMARQEAYALLDDAADLESHIGNRLRATGRRYAYVGKGEFAFKCSLETTRVVWCRCCNRDATICETALAGRDVPVYIVTVEKVKVAPKTRLLSALALNGRGEAA